MVKLVPGYRMSINLQGTTTTLIIRSTIAKCWINFLESFGIFVTWDIDSKTNKFPMTPTMPMELYAILQANWHNSIKRRKVFGTLFYLQFCARCWFNHFPQKIIKNLKFKKLNVESKWVLVMIICFKLNYRITSFISLIQMYNFNWTFHLNKSTR